MESSFQKLINYIAKSTKFRCQSYKEKPLKRRLRVRMRALNLTDYAHYEEFLREHPKEMNRLLDTITINLSYFFRNIETFLFLRNYVFPKQLSHSQSLVLWSAGCAQGEEPYSLAIAAAENRMLDNVRIYGTDIDSTALYVAEQGLYSDIAFQYMPEEYLRKYFSKTEKGFLINSDLKRRVEFLHADLFDAPPFENCDLIMCRNVLIYLDRQAQSLVLRNFYDNLKDNGYMVIGKVELLIGLPEVRLFETISRVEHIYQKKGMNN